MSEKSFWKLQDMVSTIYKTISNINIVFSNYFQNIQSCNFFPLDWYIGLKSDHICKLKKIHFLKISEQAPLRLK